MAKPSLVRSVSVGEGWVIDALLFLIEFPSDDFPGIVKRAFVSRVGMVTKTKEEGY